MAHNPQTLAEYEPSAECSLAGEYSALWRANVAPPDLDSFLRLRSDASREQRARLVLFDQARSWSTGEGRTVEDYLHVCPELTENQDLLLKLIVSEYVLQEPPPAVTEFVDRFPRLKAELLDQLCCSDEISLKRSEADEMLDLSAVDDTATDIIDAPSNISETAQAPSGLGLTRPRPTLKNGQRQPVDGQTHSAASGACRLRDSFPFNSLPITLVSELESHMIEQTFGAGEFLTRQGDAGTSFLVREGIVDVVVTDEFGVPHEIARSGPGDILGEMALLTDEPRTASIVARESVKVLVLPEKTFHEYATRNPEISHVLTQLLAERLGGGRRDVLFGKTLDRYRIVRRLGKGGMAVVYEGADQTCERRVALKMLSHRLVYDKTSLAWFQREADLIESFEHPNIVRMFGRFHAFHSYFIVMEFCDGITLERLVRLNGPLNQDNFRKAFGQLASAVLYAHQRGIIHRDIKPGNLMLNFDGQLKLMDFGLARPLRPASADTEAEAQVVGTPRYMAPEQLRGQELSVASDYFSLGCTAYKLLTGESLFAEPDVVKLRELHARWKVPHFAKHRRKFGHELCELLACCLHRRPKKRVCDLAKYATWAAPLDVAGLL